MRHIWVVAAAVVLVAGGRAVVSARDGGARVALAIPATLSGAAAAAVDAVPAGCPGCSAPKESGSVIHSDCDACAGWAECLTELEAARASMQVMKLKNGVMYVCMADTPARVRAVRAALARRHERLKALTAEGERARLCPECRAMRGATASGKLTRELINIDGGCISVTTSSEASVVEKIQHMAGFAVTAPVKG